MKLKSVKQIFLAISLIIGSLLTPLLFHNTAYAAEPIISLSCTPAAISPGETTTCTLSVAVTNIAIASYVGELNVGKNLSTTNIAVNELALAEDGSGGWNSEKNHIEIDGGKDSDTDFYHKTITLATITIKAGDNFTGSTVSVVNQSYSRVCPEGMVCTTDIPSFPDVSFTLTKYVTPVTTPSKPADKKEETKSDNNYLKTLKPSTGSINFKKDTLSYYLEIPNNLTKVDFEAVAEDSKATIEIKGNTNLLVGDNTVNITVKAQSGKERTYIIKIYRLDEEEVANGNNYLSSLSVEGYELSFDKNTFTYNLTNVKTKSLDITAIPVDSSASVTISGNENLKNGSVIAIKVTAQNGSTREYTITVKMASKLVPILLVIAGITLVAGVASFIFYKKKTGKSLFGKPADNTVDSVTSKTDIDNDFDNNFS